MNPQVFPVKAANTAYRSTFGAPRDGGKRTHKGIDFYAERGAEVLAVEDGYATRADSTLGGIGVAVTTSEKTVYYYAHLDGLAGGFPRNVRAGETLGYVGSTGNAAGGPPHLHFEIRPLGADPVDPFPIVENLRATVPAPLVAAPSRPKAKSATSKGSEGVGLGALVLIGLWVWSERKKGGRRGIL